MDLEHRHRDALRRIYQAEQIWSDQGNQPRSFMLVQRGGMRSDVDHPAWDPSSAVPSEHTIDDLNDLALLRVEPSDTKARTFVLGMNGRRQGAAGICARPSTPSTQGHGAWSSSPKRQDAFATSTRSPSSWP